MKLYEITDTYRILSDALAYDQELTVENFDTLKAQLDAITEQLNQKVESIGKVILNNESDLECIEKELERLATRKKTLENKNKWLKDYLLQEMIVSKLDKIPTSLFTVSACKSPNSVVILNKEDVPQEFRREIPATWDVNKKLILEKFLESGEVPNGCDIITTNKYLKIR